MDQLCPDCGLLNETRAKYCTGCGLPLVCPRCGAARTRLAKFCIECGAPYISDSRIENRVVRADCRQCEHYRPPVHISSHIHFLLSSAEASDALMDIQKEERSLEAQEVAELRDLLARGVTEWRQRPMMSAYCAEHEDKDRFEILEVKNQSDNCPSFRTDKSQRVSCGTCRFRHPFLPENLFDSGPNGGIALYRAKAKDAAGRYANEILGAWYGKGYLTVTPRFHDYCAALTGTRGYCLCLYANPNGRCGMHETI